MSKKKSLGEIALVPPQGDSVTFSEDSFLPVFSESRCEILTVCAYISDFSDTGATKEASFSEDAQLTGGSWLHVVSEVKPGMSADSDDRLHLHVDVKRRFKDKKPTSTFAQLAEELAKYGGKTVSCWIEATYRVAVDDLPSGGVIRAFLGLSTQAGKHSLAFRGAKMTIDDEQLDELTWQLVEDGKSVMVVLDANLKTTIGTSYVKEASEFLNGAFRRIALDDEDHDNE